MQLSKYINQFKGRNARAAEIRRLATELNISPSYIRGLILGLHKFPAKLAIPLFVATDGKVLPNETCPDFYPIEVKFKKQRVNYSVACGEKST